MSDPTVKQIIEALEQSGYLFEQEVADQLEALDFHVETGWAFRDLEQDKSRELDVRAVKRILHDEVNKLDIFIELLVECKAYESPMVFLQRNKNSREQEHSAPREYIFPNKTFRKQINENSFQEIPSFVYLNMREQHYYYRDSLKATQFSKIVRKSSAWIANHDGIYDSLILPLAKALESRRKNVPVGPDWSYIWLFFPMVVLREGLFSLEINQKPLNPTPQGRVSFVRHLETESNKGFYLTDFVTITYLNNYINNEITPFAQSIIEMCKNEPTIYRTTQ